ncbi:tetratricopeptide repeat protein [Thermodesulfobacteriota bacterium]
MFDQVWQYFSDPDNQKFAFYLLALLICGFIAGRLSKTISRKDLKPRKIKGDNAFFKGIQYLLSDDPNHAIEEFTKSVQVNSDTIETYVALGNLFRSKGDIDRAIQIRKTIILRPNIDDQIKIRALYDLGLDYKKGGFLDRALEAFLDSLEKQPSNIAALEEVEKIYEEMKDWEKAFAIRKKISKLSKGDHRNILAHHKTESAKLYFEKGDITKAKSAYKKAISIDRTCVDAYLHLGDLYFHAGSSKNAMSTWKKVVKISPQLTFLAYRRLEDAYDKLQNVKQIEKFLKECVQFNSDAFTHLALARYMLNEKNYDGALTELKTALELVPSLWEAHRMIGETLLESGREEDALESYRELLSYFNNPYLEFQCTNCGYIPADLKWQCPQCKKWDTISLMNPGLKDSLLVKDKNRGINNSNEGQLGEEI